MQVRMSTAECGRRPSESSALLNTCREIYIPAVFQISGGNLFPTGLERFKAGKAHSPMTSESVSGIQDSVASSFEKFRHLLHLVSIDAHFIQRFAKVRKKPVEMPVV